MMTKYSRLEDYWLQVSATHCYFIDFSVIFNSIDKVALWKVSATFQRSNSLNHLNHQGHFTSVPLHKPAHGEDLFEIRICTHRLRHFSCNVQLYDWLDYGQCLKVFNGSIQNTKVMV